MRSSRRREPYKNFEWFKSRESAASTAKLKTIAIAVIFISVAAIRIDVYLSSIYTSLLLNQFQKKMDIEKALEIYRHNEVVENCFDELKNALDRNFLRFHSSKTMDARLFI
jgi:transposase